VLRSGIQQKKAIAAQSTNSVQALAEILISSMRMEHPTLNVRSYRELLGKGVRINEASVNIGISA
jgi:hypothetical protein